ncbi:MAG: undecaprenyl/decaprenyl-phosphate alpha-N-acetylglucosaminyl 1-phosphate transferase [Gemmatimonadaceae bacterium]|nr:undecaprenyl/decaprenyl-phosphate alpha-N-acetylglucosaminyl 1-phosphate transferase [Gemmatimonadaceae bacterium]
MQPLVIAFLIAALSAAIITPLVISGAKRWHLLDAPDATRHLHEHPVPRLGGVAVFIATMLGIASTLFFGPARETLTPEWHRFLLALLIGGTVLFGAGLVDDLRRIRPLAKIIVQCIAALIVAALGFRIEILSVGSSAVHLGWISIPLTVLWIVGVTNAFNLIDGLDGLATGIAIVALATVFAAATVLGNLEVAIVACVLIGALFGFARYNFSPARIFLGDSGSLFIGFMLAVLSMHGSIKSATAVLVAIPLFALAVPLLDVSVSIVRRFLRGVPIFSPDARHIHHRLLALGLTPGRASFVLCLVAGGFAVLGLLLAFAPPPALIGMALTGGLVSAGIFMYGIRQLDYNEFVEAGAALASGIVRVRRVIRDQIHARELTSVIEEADSLRHVNQLLAASTPSFGFLGVEVERESSLSLRRLNGKVSGLWKLDYMLASANPTDGEPYVLRIWCSSGEGSRPFGAERLAHILVPCLETWLASPKAIGHAVAESSHGTYASKELAAVRESAG